MCPTRGGAYEHDATEVSHGLNQGDQVSLRIAEIVACRWADSLSLAQILGDDIPKSDLGAVNSCSRDLLPKVSGRQVGVAVGDEARLERPGPWGFQQEEELRSFVSVFRIEPWHFPSESAIAANLAYKSFKVHAVNGVEVILACSCGTQRARPSILPAADKIKGPSYDGLMPALVDLLPSLSWLCQVRISGPRKPLRPKDVSKRPASGRRRFRSRRHLARGKI